MGDKSPKSKQKNQSQKQGRAEVAAKEKQRMIDSKKAGAASPGKKR